MQDNWKLEVIARIHSDFSTKFGIPRQSGLVETLSATIVFEPAYRDANALRGLHGFSHIWLLWGFSGVEQERWSPMVKPPRLGGNKRMGVFATRSPFRPNPIGLSSVRLVSMQATPGLGTVLRVSGADLMDGSPIYDIKPYLAFTDSHPDALGGFAGDGQNDLLQVNFDEKWLRLIPENKREALIAALALDPRPAYQNDPRMAYGFAFAGFDIRFRVQDRVLSVFEVVPL